MAEEAGSEGFLPPEAPGAEPNLAPPPPPLPPPAAPVWQQAQPAVWGPPDPGNGIAVTGFVLSLCGLGLLFVSSGLSSLFSVGLGITGIVLGVKGRRRVADGVTRQHRDLGTAGLVIGIIAVVLGVIATAAWAAILVWAIASGDGDSNDPFDGGGEPAVLTVQVVSASARVVGVLLS